MYAKKLTLALLTVAGLASAAPTPEAAAAALPEAFASALADPESATYACHASCGYAILTARNCTSDGSSSDSGPWDDECLCTTSLFDSYADECLDCGWCLWDDYGSYLSSALAECDLSTTPTGTSCASTATA